MGTRAGDRPGMLDNTDLRALYGKELRVVAAAEICYLRDRPELLPVSSSRAHLFRRF